MCLNLQIYRLGSFCSAFHSAKNLNMCCVTVSTQSTQATKVLLMKNPGPCPCSCCYTTCA